jgi:hypothetical protein
MSLSINRPWWSLPRSRIRMNARSFFFNISILFDNAAPAYDAVSQNANCSLIPVQNGPAACTRAHLATVAHTLSQSSLFPVLNSSTTESQGTNRIRNVNLREERDVYSIRVNQLHKARHRWFYSGPNVHAHGMLILDSRYDLSLKSGK